jgi:hypothetical protein
MEQRTLAQLRADLRYSSDTESLTDRHPDIQLNRLLNQSIRSLRILLTEAGGRLFVQDTGVLSLVGTALANESYSVVPWPPTAVSILGIDVQTTNVSPVLWQSCRPVTFSQRRNRQSTIFPANVNTPIEWTTLSVPTGSGSSVVAGSIALFPAASSGNYKIFFLPDFIDLSADTDLFIATPDAMAWVVEDCVLRLSERDDDQRQTAQLAAARKQEAQLRLYEGVQQTQLTGPLRPRRSAKGRSPWRV